jgi:hypothetical protein
MPGLHLRNPLICSRKEDISHAQKQVASSSIMQPEAHPQGQLPPARRESAAGVQRSSPSPPLCARRQGMPRRRSPASRSRPAEKRKRGSAATPRQRTRRPWRRPRQPASMTVEAAARRTSAPPRVSPGKKARDFRSSTPPPVWMCTVP